MTFFEISKRKIFLGGEFGGGGGVVALFGLVHDVEAIFPPSLL